jgi:hypothetical protein
MAAERYTEARIGQLLGDAQQGVKSTSPHAEKIHPERRKEFRLLGKLLDTKLARPEEWRKSRRALVALARQRLAKPPAPLSARLRVVGGA